MAGSENMDQEDVTQIMFSIEKLVILEILKVVNASTKIVSCIYILSIDKCFCVKSYNTDIVYNTNYKRNIPIKQLNFYLIFVFYMYFYTAFDIIN